MNTDYKSLERRYGTLLATKIHEEIVRADLRRLSYYKLPPTLRALQERYEEAEDDVDFFALPKNDKAA